VREDELAALLQSPALSLEPPPDLAASARRGARRVRRRRTAATAVLSVAGLAAAALVVPALLSSTDDPPDVAAADLARLFPAATSEVVPLADMAGGTVYTYFQGGQWCTVSKRTGPPNTTCAGSLPASGVRAFAFLRGPGTESLAVDRDFIVAGLLGDGIASVDVELTDGRVLQAATSRGEGFPRPVWWQQLAPGDRVAGYAARDASGDVVQTLPVSEQSSEVSPVPSG
jgi:hypothetical protein